MPRTYMKVGGVPLQLKFHAFRMGSSRRLPSGRAPSQAAQFREMPYCYASMDRPEFGAPFRQGSDFLSPFLPVK